jgi:guanylate kinase
MSGKAIIFSAPSGAGKTTIVRHLLSHFLELQFSISATTRPKRVYEIQGRDYYFMNNDEFDAAIRNGDLLEWQEVYSGVNYGTLRMEVERIWAEGKVVIFDVDVIGGINLKKELKDSALAVFIRVKDVETLKNRLIARNTESEETLQLRIGKAVEEMAYETEFDTVIINEELAQAQADAVQLVGAFIKN